MKYQPIVATNGYILSPDRKQVLLLHRNTRLDDEHYGKWNGLGGKMHPEEDILGCMRREIREEAGIDCTKLHLRGSINWTGFGSKGLDWLGFIFLVTEFSGSPIDKNPEGTLEWVDIDQLYSLPLWEGDHHFLPLVFDQDPRMFHGYMPYKNGKLVSWSYERI